jgi:hypothetical protein
MATILAGNPTYTVSNDVWGFGHTFTADLSGWASEFSLVVAARESGSGMQVTVSTFDGFSSPPGSIIGQMMIPESALTESLAWVTAQFKSPIFLEKGKTYYVNVTQFQSGRDGYNLYAYSNANPYAGGMEARYVTSNSWWNTQPATDFAFQIGGTVPEPASGLLIALGVVAAAWKRRR